MSLFNCVIGFAFGVISCIVGVAISDIRTIVNFIVISLAIDFAIYFAIYFAFGAINVVAICNIFIIAIYMVVFTIGHLVWFDIKGCQLKK